MTPISHAGWSKIWGKIISLASSAAHAVTFGVRVVDAAGEPVVGASVCVGLGSNFTQFGAEFTDAAGVVVMEVPNVPLVVTVSKTRFAGVRMSEPARGFNLIKEVTLVDGLPGPRCRAGSALADAPGIDAMHIKNIDITRGASLVLRPNVTGNPTHYRVSNNPEFTSASWQPYTDSIRLSRALSRESALYFQLRQYAGNSKAWLEARSDAITITLTN